MSKNVSKEKMKSFVLVRPRTAKGKIIAVLFLLLILCASVPIINFVNKPILVFGMPMLMAWSLGLVFAIVIVLRVAMKWGVH